MAMRIHLQSLITKGRKKRKVKLGEVNLCHSRIYKIWVYSFVLTLIASEI